MRQAWKRGGWRASAAAAAVALAAAVPGAARAVSIELRDVAPDRIERQRAAVEGRLPLAGTPDLGALPQRLAAAGVSRGAPVMLRIFKETSELEIWMQKDGTYKLFATYPICHWGGTLGPKLREGDKQTPEGFYTITNRQLHHIGRWPRAIDLGYPNAYDTQKSRDGSYILMHGGCSSVGCVAMTNAVIAEVYELADAAMKGGQRFIPLHIFPFRMTDAAMAARAASEWLSFWTTLRKGYDSFERTHRPPRISVCKGEYIVEDAPEKSAEPVPMPASTRNRRENRSDIALGAIRTTCPEEVVAGGAH